MSTDAVVPVSRIFSICARGHLAGSGAYVPCRGMPTITARRRRPFRPTPARSTPLRSSSRHDDEEIDVPEEVGSRRVAVVLQGDDREGAVVAAPRTRAERDAG